MSKADFSKVVKTQIVIRGIQTLTELVGEEPLIVLKTVTARKKWDKLVKLHDKFQAMNIEERAKFAEVSIEPAPASDSTPAAPKP